MTLKIDKSVLLKAIEHYGIDLQMDVLIEEMAELTQALIKSRRDGRNVYATQHVYEEAADVNICLESLKLVMELKSGEDPEGILQYHIHEKLTRLTQRMIVNLPPKYLPGRIVADINRYVSGRVFSERDAVCLIKQILMRIR